MVLGRIKEESLQSSVPDFRKRREKTYFVYYDGATTNAWFIWLCPELLSFKYAFIKSFDLVLERSSTSFKANQLPVDPLRCCGPTLNADGGLHAESTLFDFTDDVSISELSFQLEVVSSSVAF